MIIAPPPHITDRGRSSFWLLLSCPCSLFVKAAELNERLDGNHEAGAFSRVVGFEMSALFTNSH